MAPVNLDDQAFWAPRTPLSSWSRAARRRRSGSARPSPLNGISSSGMLNGEAPKSRPSPPSADDSVASLKMEQQTSENRVSKLQPEKSALGYVADNTRPWCKPEGGRPRQHRNDTIPRQPVPCLSDNVCHNHASVACAERRRERVHGRGHGLWPRLASDRP